ncbi:hypothetical protein [Paracoccus sediminilitoris]|uniref:hypothetical protein n=1 Tax=Paracoccus sediminilitoris TaxID=2202419 RepID=UPI0011B9449F|nr:hypothetical protein [Paracoccus sediminilitoris]
MPIFVSTTCRVFKVLKAEGINFSGFDASAYLVPFTSELDIDLSRRRFSQLRLRGFGPLDLIPIPIEQEQNRESASKANQA